MKQTLAVFTLVISVLSTANVRGEQGGAQQPCNYQARMAAQAKNTLRFVNHDLNFRSQPGQPLRHTQFTDGVPNQRTYAQLVLSAYGVHVVDVDGDGDGDILGLHRQAIPRVQWHENRRNECLIPSRHLIEKPILENHITAIQQLAPIDLNADQRMDIIVMGTKLAVLNNRGNTKPWEVTSIHNSLVNPHHLLVKDVDGDGDTDVIYAGQTSAHGGSEAIGGVMWFENRDGVGQTWSPGKPIFAEHHDVPLLVVGDLTADHSLDVVFFESRLNRLMLFSQESPGGSWLDRTLADYEGTSAAAAEHPSQLATGDIDRDGNTDLISVHKHGQVFRWNLGQRGTDSAAKELLFALPRRDASAAPPQVQQLLVQDLDQNGSLEILVRLRFPLASASILCYRRQAEAWERIDIATGRSEITRLAIGDYDGDGDLDMVTSRGGQVPEPLFWLEN